jgi:hypothetical protein
LPAEESEEISEDENAAVKMQVLLGGLADAGFLQNSVKKESTATKENEYDSSGEYIERIWSLDLKVR